MKCQLCGSNDNQVVATKIREGEGRIVQCKSCGLVFQDTEFAKDELEKYYNDIYQKTNSLTEGSEQSPQNHFDDRMKTIKPTFERLNHIMKENFENRKIKVLELGCSTGELLHLLSPYIEKGVGIELNQKYVQWANNYLEENLSFIDKDINDVELGDTFDLIVSNYTLDHLPNPLETLLTLKSILKQDGIMYLELPNRDEALNYYLSEKNEGKYQEFFWHKAHMFYFTGKTISAFLSKIQMNCETSCFHEYSLRNYLQWYFCGQPDSSFSDAINDTGLFKGNSDFERRMNVLMESADVIFKSIMSDTWSGDTICVIARKEEE